MELSVSPSSSLRIPAITPLRSSASSHRRNGRGSKPTCQCSASPYFKLSQSSPSPGASSPKSRSRPAPGRYNGKNLIQACARVGAAGSDPILSKVSDFKDACWRFLRPHTIRGTALGSLVNKPYLPIAAGDLSIQHAWLLVIFFAVTGLLIVASNFGSFITSLYSLGLFLGTIYSVPPFRMKRFPVAAFLIIATVRGFLLNFGVYHATRAALGLPFEWSSPVAFITSFVSLFALVIAITKDLPDVEGDRKFQISTFATKLGVRNIAFLGSGLLLLNYVAAIVAAVYMPQAFRRSLMIPAHSILALGLIFQAWVLERANYTKEAIAGYYRFIWNLFYAEYIIFPFI
ncbi:homogentisate solanesyltransferase, chloroplastic isoform X3 [Rhodamnia argentea]|uniref:Homogentisate solanesyltransferase, chloroplastic isoform X3 n=1 Tax=Rhodamnia argentea TaxID=178133 RepID=A0ABM3GSD1_9MYRT|nr:homogentisate solanesyltransferase, chloroplastic isoform X3 [Rhodamnia argentea]